MIKKYVVQVKYSKVNCPSLFATDIEDLKINDYVLVNTERGRELGKVVSEPVSIEHFSSKMDFSPIMARANDLEINKYKENIKKAEAALEYISKEAQKAKLNMDFLAAEYLLDLSKIIITYTAEGRIDFRELLKTITTELHTRIEFKQIGPRDKAKSLGGVGPCGRKLCCVSFLKNFDGISINRAKNQQLSLNISKISGSCGKLMCCLNFEDECYSKENKLFPQVGTIINYNNNKYKVLGFNIISRQIKCEGPEGIEFISLNNIKKK